MNPEFVNRECDGTPPSKRQIRAESARHLGEMAFRERFRQFVERWRPGKVIVHETAPRVLGGFGEKLLRLFTTGAADHEGIQQVQALAESGNDEVVHASALAWNAANGALIDSALMMHGLLIELVEPSLGFVRELIHHRVAAMLAQGVFDDTFPVSVGFGHLITAFKVRKALAAAGAALEGALFVFREKITRDRREIVVLRIVHDS